MDAYYAECKARGVEMIIAPGDREYGVRDFGLKDLDGNILNFGCEV